MARYVELRRHTDADGDILTQEGVRAATEIGARLRGDYDLFVSTGAQRATQTLACFLAALGERVGGGVIVETGLRSGSEERWLEAYEKAARASDTLASTVSPAAPDASSWAPRAGSTQGGAAAREARAGRRSILRCESWSCGSPARIRAGDTRGSPVSY